MHGFTPFSRGGVRATRESPFINGEALALRDTSCICPSSLSKKDMRILRTFFKNPSPEYSIYGSFDYQKRIFSPLVKLSDFLTREIDHQTKYFFEPIIVSQNSEHNRIRMSIYHSTRYIFAVR